MVFITLPKDIEDIILTHFNNFPLRGTKYLDFLDFQKAFFLSKKISQVSDESEKFSLLNEIKTIKSNCNSSRSSFGELSSDFYQPKHTLQSSSSNSDFIPLNPHYISGFFEGDGSFLPLVELSGSTAGRLSISLDQNFHNKLLLESFKIPLNINSNLVLNKTTNVFKLTKFGDKYFKEFLIPFFIQYPLHGHKLIQFFKIIHILSLKDSNKPNHQFSEIWLNQNFNSINLDNFFPKAETFNNLLPVKSSHNSLIIYVNTVGINTPLKFNSIIQASRSLKVSPKLIAKYLNKGVPYKNFFFNTNPPS